MYCQPVTIMEYSIIMEDLLQTNNCRANEGPLETLCFVPRQILMQIYNEWRRWLESPSELPQIVMERIYQRGEYLRRRLVKTKQPLGIQLGITNLPCLARILSKRHGNCYPLTSHCKPDDFLLTQRKSGALLLPVFLRIGTPHPCYQPLL